MYKHVKHILDVTLGQDVILEIPKDSRMGHFATPIAFILAKKEKKSPKEIAKKIVVKLNSMNEFSNVCEVNGFINITLSDEFLSAITQETLANPSSFAKGESSDSILLEFVSANPTGPLHIGHARGAVFGDILARIGTHLGYKITKEYYINDAGSQIDMLGISVYIVGREILGASVNYPDTYYKGEYIVDIAKDAIAEFGEGIFSDESSLKIIKEFAMARMLEVIKENLNSANIAFDNFVSENTIMQELPSVLEKLQLNNATYTQDSKLWLKSSLRGDQKDRVIIRETNEPTYLAGDIVYHYNKFIRNYDRYINIWGADHHGYIARIKASIEFLGYDSSKFEVLLSQMVSLLKAGKPYKMSKRAGNFILMQDILEDIGADAMRFIFISKKADTHLEFDVDILKNEDSNNPIYYINYANARIHTIFSKSKAKMSYDFSRLEPMWKDLLIFAMILPKILESAFSERALQKLPEYLKSLSAKLHFCYNSSKIIDSSNEGNILSILSIVSLSITTGLGLMGIIAKTKM